jgi:hypothetical protein
LINYTQYLTGIIADMVKTQPELGHIKIPALVVSFSRAKTKSRSGLLASLTPLRFEGGSTVTKRNDRLYEIPQVQIDGIPKLYIVSFIYPRFMDLGLIEKARTIVHELYHISVNFDGDIRRFNGRTFAHSGRKANFDAKALEIASNWLKTTTIDTSTLAMNVLELKTKYGKIAGTVAKRPRIKRLP